MSYPQIQDSILKEVKRSFLESSFEDAKLLVLLRSLVVTVVQVPLEHYLDSGNLNSAILSAIEIETIVTLK
jgi:hypothetical protein